MAIHAPGRAGRSLAPQRRLAVVILGVLARARWVAFR